MNNIYYSENQNHYPDNLQNTQFDPETYSITINTVGHTLTLYKNGTPIRNYTVAVGKPSTPTPMGSYKIINKYMNPGGPYGVRWLGMSIPRGGYGIHGTNNPASIGKSISHGCVRMYNKDVIELYNLAPVSTPVNII